MALMDSQRLDVLGRQRPDQVGTRGHIDVLLERARVLEDRERSLVELAFKRGLSMREIARLTERDAGTVSRQLQRICKRLRDPIVAALLDRACPLGPEYRLLAIEFFAQGKLLADLAEKHQMSRGTVRQMLHFVRGWYRGVHLARRELAPA